MLPEPQRYCIELSEAAYGGMDEGGGREGGREGGKGGF